MKFKISTEAGDEAFQRRHCALYCDSVGGDITDYNAAQNLGSKTDFPDLTVVDLHQKKIIKVQLRAQQPYEDVRITFFR